MGVEHQMPVLPRNDSPFRQAHAAITLRPQQAQSFLTYISPYSSKFLLHLILWLHYQQRLIPLLLTNLPMQCPAMPKQPQCLIVLQHSYGGVAAATRRSAKAISTGASRDDRGRREVPITFRSTKTISTMPPPDVYANFRNRSTLR
jgi:hypothetical protein